MALDWTIVTAWVEGYRRAWASNDEADIAALFTEDATYQDGLAEPWIGRDAIVARWLEQLDEPGTWEFTWEPVALEGDVAVITGLTVYPEAEDRPHRFHNIWLLRFDGSAVSAFVDRFMGEK